MVTLLGFLLNGIVFAEKPLSQNHSIAGSTTLQLPAVRLTAKSANITPSLGQAAPLQFAEPFSYQVDMLKVTGWQVVRDRQQDMAVLRYQINSPNAVSLNLGFSRFAMPKGGQLFVYADNHSQMLGPFTHKDNESHGQLWTPVINGKQITIEVNIPLALKAQLQLELTHINQGFLDINNVSKALPGLKSGSCNVDVVCPVGNAWQNQSRSVARYTRNGVFLCSGAAINNTAGDKKAYFLTADHCGFTFANAPSIVAYWNYQNSVCRAPGSSNSGASGNGSLMQFNSGAVLRAHYPDSDMALLEFDDPILLSANAYLAGWSRATSVPTSAVGIHHPSGEEKRISFEYNPLSISGYFGVNASTHLRVSDWDLGTTEGGSSGSPLFDQNKRIVGQLHGGLANCGNNSADWYGRFAVSWSGGGTSDSRLSDWLDPIGSGQTVMNGVESLEVDSFEPDNTSATAKPIVSGVPQTHSLHANAEQDWLTFTLTQAADINITMQAGANDVAEITLYDASLVSLANDNGSAAQINLASLPAGTYFIRAEEFENNAYIGSYTLTYNAFAADQYESDNDSSSATVMPLGVTQTHSIYPVTDEDWVRFTLLQPITVAIRTLGVLGDTQMWLYDAMLNQLAYDNNSGTGLFSNIVMELPAGSYFVRINESNNQAVASYRLRISEEGDILWMVIPAILAGSKQSQ